MSINEILTCIWDMCIVKKTFAKQPPSPPPPPPATKKGKRAIMFCVKP